MPVIEEICGFEWNKLNRTDLTAVAWAYYYFSVQFRENLKVTLDLYPDDPQIQNLVKEECNTDNLSPWQGVAEVGEAMNHDEFMRRLLTLSSQVDLNLLDLSAAGERYLRQVRKVSDKTKAMSIASYECGGLESVFKAFLAAPDWDTPLLKAFRHFLVKHIDFDSDPEAGHGALAKHIIPDDRIRVLWVAFRNLLQDSVPHFAEAANIPG
ncbi:unnamed protein product [Sphagnum tenellum]